jgi:hypothetical protein
MSNPNDISKKQDDVKIEPLSDKALEDVSGGCVVDSCSTAACSGCTTEVQ